MYINDILCALNLPYQLCSIIWLLYGFFNKLILDAWYTSEAEISVKYPWTHHEAMWGRYISAHSLTFLNFLQSTFFKIKHKFSLRVSPSPPTENSGCVPTRYPLKRRLGAPRADLNTLEKRKFSYSYHDPLVVQPVAQSLYWQHYPGSPYVYINWN